MKKLLLLQFAFIFFTANIHAQVTCNYTFNNNLHDVNGHGVDLGGMCADSFTSVTLPASVTKNVYVFRKGCGLTFFDSTTNFLSSGAYTIELYMKLDTVSGYKKLVDFKDTSVDPGLYNQNGQLVLYSVFTADSVTIQAGQYEYIALSRDASGNMISFVNNKFQKPWLDTAGGGQYKYNNRKKLIFFRDDHGTGGEQTSGAVAMIRISNFAMDSNTIKYDYDNLGPILLDVPNVIVKNDVNIYPNPATDNLHINTGSKYDYNLCDITGKTILTGDLKQGDNNICISSLSTGLYLLNLTDNNGIRTTYKISKN
jgi:hypothetical protein